MVEKTSNTVNDLKNRKWFNELNADYTKILGAAPSTQEKTLNALIAENIRCEKGCSEKQFKHVMTKKDFLESKNVKELCRNGIPFNYFRDVVLKMFNAQTETKENYDLKLAKVFKGRDITKVGDYCPFYTGLSTLSESLPINFINSDGVSSVKQIQWMLNSVIPTIEFTPTLIRLNSILHILLQPFEVYFVLRNLLNLNYNIKETHKIRWHMRFTYEDNNRLISSILESFKEISAISGKGCIDHLESIGFKPSLLVEDIIYNLFMGYLRIEGVYRLIGFYLREGVKALYRMIFALLKTLNSSILDIISPDLVIESVRKLAQEIPDYSKLFDLAYSFNITRNNNKYDFQDREESDEYLNKRSSYYLPNYVMFEKAQRILSEQNLILLWSKLPLELKIRDCHMIFSSSVDGFSLKSIYHAGTKLIQKNMNNPSDYVTLFLIETQNNEVFGGLMSKLIFPTGNSAERPEKSLLIRFEPNFNIFEPVPNTQETVLMDNNSFLFGIGDTGASIRLDSELSHGFSNFSTSFNSPVLTNESNGEYFVKQVEVYVLL